MSSPESSDREFLRMQARRRVLRTRLLMAFAIGSTTAFVCCCVPMVAFQIAFGPEITKDPLEIEAVGKQIAPLMIPPDFAAHQALSADNALLQTNIVRYDHNEGRGRLVIGKLKLHPGHEYDVQLLKNLVEESFAKRRTLDVKNTRQKVIKIRGQKVTFLIQEGEDQASTTRLKQVSGAFSDAAGALQLLLQVESEFLTDDAIDALVMSLSDEQPEVLP